MKPVLICTGLLFAATTLMAQQAPPMSMPPAPAGAHHGVPQSPPATATASFAGKAVTITYSSPRVRGREGKIFTKDGLISHDPHYPVWRAGANAATILKTDGDITLGDLHVPAGTYTLFVDMSNPTQWMLIVSKATGEWGLSYDPAKDLGKTAMSMSKPSAMVEDLTYTLTDDGDGKGTLKLEWENMSASVHLAAH